MIGPLWIRETIENCLMMFPSIQSTLRLSDQLTDAITFTEQLRDEVDAILYSGQVPYSLARSSIPSDTPAFFIPLKGTGLYQALYKLRLKFPSNRLASMELPQPSLENVRTELNGTIRI